VENAATIRDLLAAWYHLRRRRLPWREEPTPYRVWISEIMLQQTQVATVIPYFDRFIQAFPTVQALAEAQEQEVLSLWAGLGYYRRARFLHKAAKTVVADYDGELPTTPEGLRELPGIGAYTSNAIASVSHGYPAAVVDGNVNRVIARLVALETEVNTTAGVREVQAIADTLLDREDPSSHNQAMMELGALVCSPRNPQCETCPVRTECAANALGTWSRYPLKRKKAKPQKAHEVAGLYTRNDGAILLARRPNDALLGGLWELPGGVVPKGGSRKTALEKAWRERLDVRTDVGTHRASVEHVFSHRRLTLEIYEVRHVVGDPSPSWYPEVTWRHPDAGDGSRIADLPLSKLTRKVFDALGIRL